MKYLLTYVYNYMIYSAKNNRFELTKPNFVLVTKKCNENYTIDRYAWINNQEYIRFSREHAQNGITILSFILLNRPIPAYNATTYYFLDSVKSQVGTEELQTSSFCLYYLSVLPRRAVSSNQRPILGYPTNRRDLFTVNQNKIPSAKREFTELH